jgi:hypothetical protein
VTSWPSIRRTDDHVPALLAVLTSLSLCGCSRTKREDAETKLLGLDRLALVNVRAEAISHDGRAAIRLTEDPAAPQPPDSPLLAIVHDTELAEGTIDLFVAGAPQPDAGAGARGFVGVAFHVQERGDRYQAFYLRPTNGRAEDQTRRNHATQYQAMPDYPWHRLRSEQPGVYESYVDLEPDRWTQIRIESRQESARLFVHGNAQPALIVNDLKTKERNGGIALWIGPGTVAHFAGLRVGSGF